MQYKICFYTSSDGRCYIREYLDELETKNPKLLAIIMAKLSRAQYPQLHKEPLMKKVHGRDYHELKSGGRNTSRIFFVKTGDRLILLMNGYTKKDTKLKEKELKLADKILKDIKQGEGSYEEVTI